MALVGYSDSEEEDEHFTPPPPKRRRVLDDATNELPPLPTTFLDLYSSTVRTSTQDDPSLHGGRSRVTPHVEGNWPTHVYLEWHPQAAESQTLSDAIAGQSSLRHASKQSKDNSIHSLLQNELGVSLPLHVSLSRPLVLKTEQRAAFLDQLKKGLQNSGVRAFFARPAGLTWHPNETGTRHFLVASLKKPENNEMQRLLTASNEVAMAFHQPLLYQDETSTESVQADEERRSSAAGFDHNCKFHISIAWSLSTPAPNPTQPLNDVDKVDGSTAHGMPPLTNPLKGLNIHFTEVKVRIGQDVTTIALPTPRRKGLFT